MIHPTHPPHSALSQQDANETPRGTHQACTHDSSAVRHHNPHLTSKRAPGHPAWDNRPGADTRKKDEARTSLYLRITFAALALLSTAVTAATQCDPQWQAMAKGLQSFNGSVSALQVLPNGDLVAAGTFTVAGFGTPNAVSARNVARFDGSRWLPMADGLADLAFDLTVLKNGDVVAATRDKVDTVVRWNGSSWSRLGGIGAGAHAVRAVAVLHNGDLIAAGGFTSINGVPANNIARFDGAGWSALGAGTNDIINSLAVLPNGDLIAGGTFTTAGTVAASRVARFDGANWSPIGPGFLNGAVTALAVLPNGDIVAGGTVPISRWDGTQWSTLGSGLGQNVHALTVLSNGDLLAGGRFSTVGGIAVNKVARWNGTTWLPLGSGVTQTFRDVHALAVLPGGDVVAGGDFRTLVGGTSAPAIARWDSVSWSSLAGGMVGSGVANVVVVLQNGDIVVGGAFSAAGAVMANNIARFDGLQWHPLGAGVTGTIKDIGMLPNGDLAVGGSFVSAGGVAANNIARWDGGSWSPFGAGVESVEALAVLQNGDVVAGGWPSGPIGNSHSAWRFDGANWVPMGLTHMLKHMIVRPDGQLVACGLSGPFVWNGGTSWTTLPSAPVGIVEELIALPNGHLLAAGTGVARFDGVAWSLQGGVSDRPVHALGVLPNGDLVAGGQFSQIGGAGIRNLARFNGSAWTALADPVTGLTPNVNLVDIRALAMAPDGSLITAGIFERAGALGANGIARLVPPCPAQVSSFGVGCAGSGGRVQLGLTSLPWIGGSFTAAATGMPQNGIALTVLGFSTLSLPLSRVLPQAAAGCALWVQPDFVDLRPVGSGATTATFAVPADLALVGAVLHLQVLPLELDARAQIVGAAISNRLTLTIGLF